jgi:bacillolysin
MSVGSTELSIRSFLGYLRAWLCVEVCCGRPHVCHVVSLVHLTTVVAHEYSHGVTSYTSNLWYDSESGALSEGFSDAIAATADRLILGKDPQFVWSIGEGVDVAGVGIRNMADPTVFRDPDHFSDRYTGWDDNGGVHFNVGISNKAFFLMVKGGTHPKSGIAVTPFDADFDTSLAQAATIYFKANTQCLTEASDFLAMRDCTLLFSNATQKPTVQAAWEAVGVKALQSLAPGALTSLSLLYNHDVQVFRLSRNLEEEDSVTCWLNSTTGDPNLSVRLGSSPILYPNCYWNDCCSDSRQRVEECMATSWSANTKVFVAVESRLAASGISLLCTIQEACRSLGAQCTSPGQCCSNACDGPTPATRVCKTPCLPLNSRCTSPAQCCSNTCDGATQATRGCKTACRKLNARCVTPAQCCSHTCDGATPAARVCKTCKRFGTACARSTQCCAGLTCRKRKCKR